MALGYDRYIGVPNRVYAGIVRWRNSASPLFARYKSLRDYNDRLIEGVKRVSQYTVSGNRMECVAALVTLECDLRRANDMLRQIKTGMVGAVRW